MYVIGFNGPPRSGKDTFAETVANRVEEISDIPILQVSLSTPLRRIAYQMAGWEYSAYEEQNGGYEKFKTTHFEQFGKDGRQLMIDVSERFLKPIYGQAIMAKLLLEDLKGFTGLVLIRDCGFQIEAETIIHAVGSDNFRVVRMERPGTSFEHDSREWVYHENLSVIKNRHGLPELKLSADSLVNYLILRQGWVL